MPKNVSALIKALECDIPNLSEYQTRKYIWSVAIIVGDCILTDVAIKCV